MTTDASVSPPHFAHEIIQLAMRGQKTKCLPQLPLLWVRVHQQTPRDNERRLHTWTAAPGEAAHSTQSSMSSNCCRAGAQPKSQPLLSPSCWGAKLLWFCADYPKIKSKGKQEDLLASSERGQVELTLIPYSHHLCLGLQINTIILNPQAEQRELVLFKDSIKRL